MPFRVIQWATGDVGLNALRHILVHPDLELVGVRVHSEDKAGRDAGELLGDAPVGVRATTGIDDILALDADVVCHTARAETGTPGVASGDGIPPVVEEIARILESGKNVVTTSLMTMIYPKVMGPAVVDRLESACGIGNTSFHATGLNPGFAADMWPMLMSGLCQSIDTVEVVEDCYLGDKQNYDVLVGYLGFGRPPAECVDHINVTTWRAPIELLATSLGWQIDDIELRYRRHSEPRRHDPVNRAVHRKGHDRLLSTRCCRPRRRSRKVVLEQHRAGHSDRRAAVAAQAGLDTDDRRRAAHRQPYRDDQPL